jgi:hypothetical protein
MLRITTRRGKGRFNCSNKALTRGRGDGSYAEQHANDCPNETTGRRAFLRRRHRLLATGAGQAPLRRRGFKGTLKESSILNTHRARGRWVFSSLPPAPAMAFIADTTDARIESTAMSTESTGQTNGIEPIDINSPKIAVNPAMNTKK